MNEYRNGTQGVPPVHYNWGSNFVDWLTGPKDLSGSQLGGTIEPSEYTTPVAPGQQIQGGFGYDPTQAVPAPLYGEEGDSSQDLYATMDEQSLQVIAEQGNVRAQQELVARGNAGQSNFVPQEANVPQMPAYMGQGNVGDAVANQAVVDEQMRMEQNAAIRGRAQQLEPGSTERADLMNDISHQKGVVPELTGYDAVGSGNEYRKGGQANLGIVPPVVEETTQGRGKFGDKKDTDLSLIAQTERRTSTDESLAASRLAAANAKLQQGIANTDIDMINEAEQEKLIAEEQARLAAEERAKTDAKAESVANSKRIASITTQNREIDERLGQLNNIKDNVTDTDALAIIDEEIATLTEQKQETGLEVPAIEYPNTGPAGTGAPPEVPGEGLVGSGRGTSRGNEGTVGSEYNHPDGSKTTIGNNGTKVETDPQGNITVTGTTPTGETTTTPPVDPETATQIGSQLESFFGLNGSDIQQAIGMYLLSRATGASHSGSMRWAGQQAFKKAGDRKNKADAKAKLDDSRKYAQDKLDESRAYAEGQADEAAYEGYVLSGKYTDESLLAYRESGDVADLKALAGTDVTRGKGVKTFTNKTTQESTLFYENTINGNTVWTNGKGQTLSDDWTARTPEQSSNDLRSWKNDFQGDIDDTIAQLGIEPKDLNTTSAALSNDIASWAADKGYDVGDPEVLLHLSTIGERALRQKLRDRNTNGKKDVGIGTYMDYEALKQLSGPTEANVWVLNPSADPEKQKFAHGSFVADIEAKANYVGQQQNKTSNAVMATIIAKWNQTSDEERKALGKPSKNQNRFVLYAMQELDNLTGG